VPFPSFGTVPSKETVVIEPAEYFYNTTTIQDVGNSSNLTVGLIAEYNFSKIKAGYPEYDYQDDAIKNIEVNTYLNMATPNILSPAEYDIESKYRGDFTEIQAMIDVWPATSDDVNDIDYDIYIHCVKSPSVVGYVHTYTLRNNGILSQTIDVTTIEYLIQNVPITPRRNIDKHKNFINSCMVGLHGRDIVFTSGGGKQAINYTKIENNPAEALRAESEPFTIADYDTWFRPLEINIDAAYPSDLVNKIAANPYGVIEFRYKGSTFTGYILKMETKLSGAGSVKYSLLCTSDNDLTKLIR